MTRVVWGWIGTLAGAFLALGLAIGYDTSANVATLEGGHRHLVFAAVVWLTAGGAAVGWLFAMLTSGGIKLPSVSDPNDPPFKAE